MYSMKPIGDLYSFAYWGDNPDWLVAHGWADAASDAQRTLDQSNTHTMIARFESAGCVAEECFALETFGGAFGRGAYLIVRPGSTAERIARECLAQIEDYIVLDEDDWSEREDENRYESLIEWAKCEYRDLDAEALASWTLSVFSDESCNIGDDMSGWPDSDNPEHRPLIARAIRETRRHMRREVAA